MIVLSYSSRLSPPWRQRARSRELPPVRARTAIGERMYFQLKFLAIFIASYLCDQNVFQ